MITGMSCQALPYRIRAYMPRRIFSSTSSARVDSWQHRTPEAIYAFSPAPVSGTE